MPTRKILVADDHPQFCNALCLRLRSAGYETISASDGYQAVEKARTLWPDLLLLDVSMPAGDGFSVHERVWRMIHMRRTPVVYMTANACREAVDAAHVLGAVSVLRKPFEDKELLDVIGTTLGCDAHLRPMHEQ